MARVTDRTDWFDIWFEDKKSMMATMIRNMNSDLEAGYNPLGNSIKNQMKAIREYEDKLNEEMEFIKNKALEGYDVNKWCFYDMKKRGVID